MDNDMHQELEIAHDKIKELENIIKEAEKANNQLRIENIRQNAIASAYKQLILELYLKTN